MPCQPVAEGGEIVHGHLMLAGHRAQREQPFLDRFETCLVGIERGARGLQFAHRLGGLEDGAIKRREGPVQHAAGLVGDTRQMPLRRLQRVLDTVCAGEFG